VIDADELTAALVHHLPKQRWFGGDEAAGLSVRSSEVLRSAWPALVHVLADVHGSTYQVVLGLRQAGVDDGFLAGRGTAVVGELETEAGRALAYDAAVDPELALCLLERVAPDERVERARLLGADQSNTSMVYDERLIMKLFRRVEAGPNPDVEVTTALASGGFGAVPKPVGQWEQGGGHLAVVTEFLAGGVDGFQLALTSLRDLYAEGGEPADAGGDFGPDACRLGTIVGEMHVAMASAFGVTTADVGSWADDMDAQLARTPSVPDGIARVYETLRAVDAGPAIRVHGDLHLGQVMRTDTGWYVLDFEGEPARPLVERQRPSSALRDVAGMLRSFSYAPAVALRDHGEPTPELEALGAAWEQHSRDSFLEGYLGVDGIDAVLPTGERARTLVLAAFELDKAVYEVAYEASHRPDWVGIPMSAVQRILEETARGERTP
jgi:maltokinase